jgi:putative flippase GtrA
MRLARLRPEPRSLTGRWRKLAHEASKFGAIGAVNTVINYAVFNVLVLTVFTNGQLKANVAATVVATTSSYFMNRHWTYRDRPKSTLRREYVLFFVLNLAGMMIELGVLALAKYGLGVTGLVGLNVAKAAATGLGMVFRFWTYRTVVFRAAPTPDAPLPAPTTAVPAVVADAVPAAAETTSAAGLTPAPRSGAADAAAAAGTPVATEFAELTAPLEAELDPTLDVDLAAELDAAELSAKPTTPR